MRDSHTIMSRRTGNPNLSPRRILLFNLTYLVSCIYFLGVFPVTVHSSSPPINQGAVSSGTQAVRGSSQNFHTGIERVGSSTPLVSLLVSATSSSSASVPSSLAASSSTLGLLASTSDQDLDNETSNDQPVTKTQTPVTTAEAAAVQHKGEVLPESVPKSGSDRITTNKRGSIRCKNGTVDCENSMSKVFHGKDTKKGQPVVEATTEEVPEVKSTSTEPHTEKPTPQSSSKTNGEFPTSSVAQSKNPTTDTSTSTEDTTTTPQPSTTVIPSSSTTVETPRTTVTKGTPAVPTTPIPNPNPTPRDYIYGDQRDLSEYSEYSDAKFAEERRRDQNNSNIFKDHSRDIGDDLDLYDMEKDMNPTEGAAYERTRPNRNMSSGTGSTSNSNRDEFLQANLTGKYNSTRKQVFFPEHYPLRKMKHRTWFAQQHRLGRHGLGPIDDGPFSSLIWKDKKYLISVLVPIGVGIAGAVVFVVAAYATRSCRGAPQTFIPTVGTDLFLQHVHSRNDDIFLLMETTDDEM